MVVVREVFEENLVLPIEANQDHKFANPMVQGTYINKIGKLPKVLIRGFQGDPFLDHQMELVAMLIRNGVQVFAYFNDIGFYCVDYLDYIRHLRATTAARRWNLVLPIEANRDLEFANPMVQGTYANKIGKLPKVLIRGFQGDHQMELVAMLIRNRVQVTAYFDNIGFHCVDYLDPIRHLRASTTARYTLTWRVYYELDDERKKVQSSDVAICRVEQLCPFPYDLIQRELKRYPSMP
ncbi:hypothetical protein GIB67_037540 [Kingdonia uniflora]|uniref:2-oxoglutarate dehydrogenase E1 component/KDG C-terminal domain-containing protein n=1 Tax=Kingdonia uniflora TaxID=39325 RepID=A0A7J7NBA8_9MAGN|nr:hypothetical protein GIB67_037540 [Kingdonia uniflora]